MLPRVRSKLVARWIVVTLVASLVAAVDGGWLASWLSLAPSRIVRGELWRLVTWPLIEHGVLQLVFTCIAIYKFGGELAIRWGDRRLGRFVLEIVIATGVLASLLALLVGSTHMRRSGGWAMVDVLVIAWARQFPNATLVLYGLLALRGRELINVTIAIAIVYAAFAGPVWMAPELFGCLLAARYPTALLRR